MTVYGNESFELKSSLLNGAPYRRIDDMLLKTICEAWVVQKNEAAETEVVDNLEDDDAPQQIRYSITSYGVDYPVDGLVKRLVTEDILIPEFQRQYVWKLTQASRFIESLLLGLPVPGIFLSKEIESRKLLVIDGQQRLLTLQYFYGGIFAESGREFGLRGVQDHFKNMTYRNLREEDRRRLDDSIIHATIIQQEEPAEDDSSVYHIFERLNTGGTLLTPQEIRACVYHGAFNSLLKELNETSAWREIFGPVSKRMRDCELILRFLALYHMSTDYQPPMNEFLNKYLSKNKSLDETSARHLRKVFIQTIEIICQALGRAAFRPKKGLNAAVFDSVMVGVATRLHTSPIKTPTELASAYEMLIANQNYISATEKGTATEDAVSTRIKLAVEAFARTK